MSSVTTAKQQIKKRCHPPPSTTPSSRNSVSTSFLSDELQDVHIPTAQSVVNEITNDVNGGLLELIPDMKEDKSVSKDELYMDSKKRMNDEDTALKVAQDQKPMPHKGEYVLFGSFYTMTKPIITMIKPFSYSTPWVGSIDQLISLLMKVS